MIYFYIALGVILLPFVVFGLGWLILLICLEISYFFNKDIPYDSPRIRRAIFWISTLLIKP